MFFFSRFSLHQQIYVEMQNRPLVNDNLCVKIWMFLSTPTIIMTQFLWPKGQLRSIPKNGQMRNRI